MKRGIFLSHIRPSDRAWCIVDSTLKVLAVNGVESIKRKSTGTFTTSRGSKTSVFLPDGATGEPDFGTQPYGVRFLGGAAYPVMDEEIYVYAVMVEKDRPKKVTPRCRCLPATSLHCISLTCVNPPAGDHASWRHGGRRGGACRRRTRRRFRTHGLAQHDVPLRSAEPDRRCHHRTCQALCWTCVSKLQHPRRDQRPFSAPAVSDRCGAPSYSGNFRHRSYVTPPFP